MAAADPKLLAITPAMREGSGLVRFSKEYPQRYFDTAIAEQHAVTLAAGMATQGAKPVVAIYSTFLQRGYDQLVHDVAVQDLDVLFAIDRGGVVEPDGATHAGNLDLSFLRCVPNMLLMAPADEAEARQMLTTGHYHPGPAAVRYPRGTGLGVAVGAELTTLPIGKAQVRRQGDRIALLAFGATVPAAGAGRRRAGPDRGQHALHQAAGSRVGAAPGARARRLRHHRGQRRGRWRRLGRIRIAQRRRRHRADAAPRPARCLPAPRQPRGLAGRGWYRCRRHSCRRVAALAAQLLPQAPASATG